jgi:hypothetical protein
MMVSIISFIEDNFVLIGGLAAAFKWTYEYSQQRKFEKSKFLLERIEKFYQIEEVKLVNKLLDWNNTSIYYEDKQYVIDDEILSNALVTHDNKSKFTPTEVMIRKVFDIYFDELKELIILRDCGLIDHKNLKRFLKYWVDILNGDKKNKPKELVQTIQDYLEFYGYEDVLEFIVI